MENRSTKFTMLFFALGYFVFLSEMEAVIPPPDGGYPGFNTAEGQNALFMLTSGLWNTALGAFTLYNDTSGSGNTAVGINGLRNNVTGGLNTAVGLDAPVCKQRRPDCRPGIEQLCRWRFRAICQHDWQQ